MPLFVGWSFIIRRAWRPTSHLAMLMFTGRLAQHLTGDNIPFLGFRSVVCAGKPLFDWASMERHITEGRCPRLKQAAAEGKSMEQVMQQVQQEGEGLSTKAAAHQLSSWIQHRRTFRRSCSHVHLLHYRRRLMRSKSSKTSAFFVHKSIKAKGHKKTHWQTIHPAAWDRSQQDATSGARSLKSRLQQAVSILRKHSPAWEIGLSSSCHKVHSHVSGAGSAKTTFQQDCWSNCSRRGRGPALKQREREPVYRTKERTGILAMLCGPREPAAKDGATAAQSRTRRPQQRPR